MVPSLAHFFSCTLCSLTWLNVPRAHTQRNNKKKNCHFWPCKKKVDGLTKSRSSAFVLCMISSRGLNISLFFTYVHAPSGVDNICQPSTPVIMWKAHDSRHMHHFPCNNICPQATFHHNIICQLQLLSPVNICLSSTNLPIYNIFPLTTFAKFNISPPA